MTFPYEPPRRRPGIRASWRELSDFVPAAVAAVVLCLVVLCVALVLGWL